MPQEYLELVAAMKALTQPSGVTSEPDRVLPVAEDDWATRPDTDSYGIVSLEYEVDALQGDNRKTAIAYEGAVDLFSLSRTGGGWVEKIMETLTEHCDGAWRINHHAYERETRLFHWEFVFQIEE